MTRGAKTLEPFMKKTISKENPRDRPELQLIRIIGLEIRKVFTIKALNIVISGDL